MDYIERVVLSLSLSTRKMTTAQITAAATAQSDGRPSQNLPPTVRRSPRLSQNKPPTDKGLDVAAPDGSDNDGNGKQLEKEENRRIQGSRGLDVVELEGGDSLKKRKRSAQNDGDGKQKESSAFKKQQVERQRLVRKENRRLKERRGFDFGDIPPLGPIAGGLYEACWAETSLYPAPKVYEDMAKIGLKSYNCQYDTLYQFTKILRVYFCKTGNCTEYQIFLKAEDKSVASTEDFKLIVASVPGVTVLSSCMTEKDRRSYTLKDYLSLPFGVNEYYILDLK